MTLVNKLEDSSQAIREDPQLDSQIDSPMLSTQPKKRECLAFEDLVALLVKEVIATEKHAMTPAQCMQALANNSSNDDDAAAIGTSQQSVPSTPLNKNTNAASASTKKKSVLSERDKVLLDRLTSQTKMILLHDSVQPIETASVLSKKARKLFKEHKDELADKS
ncbi:hypothetical protein KEM56_007252 [Ascosphaera pollenicola]|nr:hypothetical protein KEM56_007252 [Ascosphaera pollenicola]